MKILKKFFIVDIVDIIEWYLETKWVFNRDFNYSEFKYYGMVGLAYSS